MNCLPPLGCGTLQLVHCICVSAPIIQSPYIPIPCPSQPWGISLTFSISTNKTGHMIFIIGSRLSLKIITFNSIDFATNVGMSFLCLLFPCMFIHVFFTHSSMNDGHMACLSWIVLQGTLECSFPWYTDLISFSSLPRSGIAESFARSAFSLLRKLHPFLHNDRTNLPSTNSV